ncbi:hypothetical protein BJV78DRAFT_393056 [Lactifluus subvellereus]|nr:hypothetical protein BJV78DRAFT_393056 [Lactifluus subvellereus]
MSPLLSLRFKAEPLSPLHQFYAPEELCARVALHKHPLDLLCILEQPLRVLCYSDPPLPSSALAGPMSNADCCAACVCLCNVFCLITTFGKGCVDVCRCMPCCDRRSDQDSLEDTGSVDVDSDHPDTVSPAQPLHRLFLPANSRKTK